jgi:glycosyltransferase involved in cell wall biosynthesis
MTNNILVSIIIPSYNSSLFISDAIKSVEFQQYPHIELIVVDDGSQDNTIEIIRQINYPVKLIQQKNHGRGFARNEGVHYA